jgi:hypothetical protein
MQQPTDDDVRREAGDLVSRNVRDRKRREKLLDEVDTSVVVRKGRSIGMVVPSLVEELYGADSEAGFRLLLASSQEELDRSLAFVKASPR